MSQQNEPTDEPTPDIRFTFLLGTMACSVFSLLTALGMLGPLLVDMSQGLATTVPVVAQLVSAAAISWAITALVIGPFSDTYGRKPILLLGTILVGLGSIGTGLSSDFAITSFFRVMAGIGGGMVPPTCMALIGDVFPHERRASSVATVTMQPGLSAIFGIPLVTLLADFAGWRIAFIGVGLGMFACTAGLFFLAPYQRQERVALNLAERLQKVTRFPVTWQLALSNLSIRMSYGLMMTFFPVFLQVTYSLSTAEVALPVSIAAVGTTLGMYLGGQMGKHPQRLLLGAVTIALSTLPGVAIFVWTDGLWLTIGIASIFLVLVMPMATMLFIVGTEVGGNARGTLAGILSSSGYVSYAFAAGFGGFMVAQFGYGSLSFALAAATISSAVLLVFLKQSQAEDRAREYFIQAA